MVYEIISLEPLPGLRGWYRPRVARGTLVALCASARGEHPLVAYVVRCAEEGFQRASSPAGEIVWESARSARPPCPSTSQCTCWGSACMILLSG